MLDRGYANKNIYLDFSNFFILQSLMILVFSKGSLENLNFTKPHMFLKTVVLTSSYVTM